MRRGFAGQVLGVLSAAALVAGSAYAQTPPAAKIESPEPSLFPPVTADYVVPKIERPEVIPAGGVNCSTCGMPPPGLPPRPPGDTCGGSCITGRPWQRCEAAGGFAGLYCHFYNAFQCRDPCYEPRWVAGANAALFVDTVRPQTSMRFRWDRGINLVLPDRSEFFWAKIGGKGPPHPETS